MSLTIIKQSKYVEEKLLQSVAEEVFSYLGQEFAVGVKFACESCIQGLNKQYRGKNEPTNVLSFNLGSESWDGDIVISEAVVERESKDLGHSPLELDLLYLVHGMLHLAGFDHTSQADRAKMETAEANILKRVGVNLPR